MKPKFYTENKKHQFLLLSLSYCFLFFLAVPNLSFGFDKIWKGHFPPASLDLTPIYPFSHCVSYPSGIQPWGGPGEALVVFFTPGLPRRSCTCTCRFLFQGVPAANFKSTPGFDHFPLLQSRGCFSPGLPLGNRVV